MGRKLVVWTLGKLKQALRLFAAAPVGDARGKFDYRRYWEDRYAQGGDSGSGSYGAVAEYKANIVNDFIRERGISSVMEFGCGDGNQLRLMDYAQYLGLDVAPTAVSTCQAEFRGDATKRFMLYDPRTFDPRSVSRADLVVCLDVLYHITDEADLEKTLEDVFACAARSVILYTMIDVQQEHVAGHLTLRDPRPIIDRHAEFRVERTLPPRFPSESRASFIFLTRSGPEGRP